MAKKKKVYEPVIETNVEGNTVIRMQERKYKMVPVDIRTHDDLIELCTLRGFGRRGQGAVVRVLVRDALAKERKDRMPGAQ